MPFSSLTRESSMDFWTEPTTSLALISLTNQSRYWMASGKLCPVSMWRSGKGRLEGWKAFFASHAMTMESLPPEKSMAGLSNCAAVSRRMKMASLSRNWRWVMLWGGGKLLVGGSVG